MTEVISIIDETRFAEICIANVIRQNVASGQYPELRCIEKVRVALANPVCFPPRTFPEVRLFTSADDFAETVAYLGERRAR